MADFRALVRRRRDGHVVFDLDVVHAGVVVEALEQTRAVLTDDEVSPDGPLAPAADAGGPDVASDGGPEGGPDGPDHAGGRPPGPADDEFDAIVAATLGGVGTGAAGTAAPAPDDPVLRRLLPDAYLDDPDASAEVRRLSGDSVRSHKVEAIDSVLVDLAVLREQDGGVAVAPERAGAWLTALNDARLALGTLLAVGEDDDLHAELDEYEERLGRGEGGDEPPEQALRAYRIAVYDFLSALLEMVVRALDR